jgi:general secretion pathway protein M
MSTTHPIARYLASANVAALIYLALVIAALLTVVFAVSDISDRYRAREASTALLAQLEHQASLRPSGANSSAPAGSPFLQGQTTTIATASLLQRVTDAIVHVKGSVTSSQVEGAGDQAPAGRVKISVECEIEERAFQQLLYEIEAGAPYLFLDRVQVRAPASAAERMQVVLLISGLWSSGK